MLDSSIKNGEININGYRIIRNDRTLSGGGVLMYIHNGFKFTPLQLMSTAEAILIQVDTSNTMFLLVCIYRPPNSTNTLLIPSLIKEVVGLSNSKNLPLIICGDFNFPYINWVDLHHSGSNALYEPFLNAVFETGLIQHVHKPTHVRGNILDLVFSSHSIIDNITIMPPILSDHSVLVIDMKLLAPSQKFSCVTHYKYQCVNLESAEGTFHPWREAITTAIAQEKSIDYIYQLFTKGIFQMRDNCVPVLTLKNKPNDPPWMTKQMRNTLRKQRYFYNTMKRWPTNYNKMRYQLARKKNKLAVRQCKKSYLNRKLYKPLLSGNSKPFFRYLKQLRSNEVNDIPSLKWANQVALTSEQKANCLNEYFESVFTIDDGTPCITTNIDRLSVQKDSKIFISCEGVNKLLNGLNAKKACGPDNISGILLKTFSSIISFSLTEIFTYSLSTSTLPMIWKTARVQPVYKKGDKHLPKNYRPISLTSIPCKLLEHIVSSHIHELFNANGFLTDSQHGFRAKRSCETQLAHTTGHISYLFDQGKAIDIIILDFSKAFDTVNHRKLLSKLECAGLGDECISWISNFLKDRQQYVWVDGETSNLRPVISGVPQGSVLGPLLFLAYINDLPSLLQSHCRLFADDALLYNTYNNANILQNDLTRLESWSKQWQMSFNISKCFFLRVGNLDVDNCSYYLGGTLLEKVNSHPYLGVELQSNLKWNKHIESIANKATQRLAMLRRALKTADAPTRKIAYFSIVRPTLEYASQIWDPYEKKYSKKLEKVQNQALRFIYQIKGRTSFSTLRAKTNFPSLKSRRQNSRYQLLTKCLSENMEPSFEYNLKKKYNTRQRKGTYTPFIRTNVFYNSFWPRTLRELRS